jgi:hypothetical protein
MELNKHISHVITIHVVDTQLRNPLLDGLHNQVTTQVFNETWKHIFNPVDNQIWWRIDVALDQLIR